MELKLIPNRIVRYFVVLGAALGHGGTTPFTAFQNGVINFYLDYLRPNHFKEKPSYYPRHYGLN
jgi:hypothetical protein